MRGKLSSPLALTLAVVASLAACAPAALAQDAGPMPAYARMRHGADHWNARGGHGGGHWGPGYGYGGFYQPPIVTGSWDARPYPYHFDYYRHRWGGEAGAEGAQPAPANCPCAETSPIDAAIEGPQLSP